MTNSMETFPFNNLHKDSMYYITITKVIYSPKLIHDQNKLKDFELNIATKFPTKM